MINRPALLLVTVAALVGAATFVWVEVRQEREFRRLIAVGEAGLAQDQTFVAIEAFSGALALKQSSMLAYLKRGDTYRRRGEYAAALRDLQEAAALDQTAPQPLEALGDVYSAMGRHSQAGEHYERYLQLDDRASRVLYKLAAAYFQNGEAPRAVDPLRKAVALDDRFAEAYQLLGVTLRQQKRHDEARRALRRAIELNPRLVAAREELADLDLQRGGIREGIEQLEEVAALEPARPERAVSLGLTYARLGRTDAAVTTLERAAARWPDDSGIHTALGRVWLETAVARDDSLAAGKAREALQRAANLPDASSETLTLYGRALLQSGDAASAERVLQQAVGRLPIDAGAYRYLAEAAARLKHTDLARAAAVRDELLR